MRRPVTFIVKVVAAWSKWGRSPEVTLGKPHVVTPVQHWQSAIVPHVTELTEQLKYDKMGLKNSVSNLT